MNEEFSYRLDRRLARNALKRDHYWRPLVSVGLLIAIVVAYRLWAGRLEPLVVGVAGLGIVVALYGAAEFYELSASHWVLDHVFVYVVLALLILFQEDIKRALARAGGTLFSRSAMRIRPSDANVLEEVIKTVTTQIGRAGTNEHYGSYQYYFGHYLFSRAMRGLTQRAEWYTRVRKELLAKQADSGKWHSHVGPGDVYATASGVLILRSKAKDE